MIAPGRSNRPRPARRLGQCPRRDERDHDADGHVDEQHPAPGQVGGQQAAGHQADRGAADAHRGVDAHRPVARRSLREGGGDQGQRGRGDDRGADALHRAGREQPGLRGGEPAEQRGQREQDDAGDEDPAPAEDVAGPAAEQQQAAEGQGVGVDHPFQAGAGEAERALDVGQRDVHDRRVQHHHQLRGGDDDQGEAEMTPDGPASAPPAGGAPGRGLCGAHGVSLSGHADPRPGR